MLWGTGSLQEPVPPRKDGSFFGRRAGVDDELDKARKELEQKKSKVEEFERKRRIMEQRLKEKKEREE